MEKKVNICDICQNTIAKDKCAICNKDICGECKENVDFEFFQLVTCRDCAERVDNLTDDGKFWKEFDKDKKFEKEIVDYLTRNLMINGLKDKKDNGEDKPFKSELMRNIRRMQSSKRRKAGRFRGVIG